MAIRISTQMVDTFRVGYDIYSGGNVMCPTDSRTVRSSGDGVNYQKGRMDEKADRKHINRTGEQQQARMDFKMAVKNGDFIRIDYTESIDGQVIAATDKEVATAKGIFDEECQYGPHLIVVGSGQLVAGMEEDLIGKEIGYAGKVEIPPEKAFGIHDPKKVESIPINKFKDKKPVPGMRVGVEDKVGTVTRILGRKASVDFNHPLADKTIVYEYKILESIEDRAEKLKSLIKTFARLDLESKIDDDVATIIVPWELGYYKEWLMIRRGLADMIIQHLGLKEVDFLEKHTGAKVSAEVISPPAKEEALETKEPEAKVPGETAAEGDQATQE